MTDIRVTMDATHCIFVRNIPPEHLMHHVLMTLYTVVLKYPVVPFLDHDRLMEVLKGKGLGMVKSVVRLGYVFPDKIVRKMTINTCGRRMVAGLLPRVILWRHDVTVDAGFWIRAEVGESLRILEGKDTKPRKNPQQDGQCNRSLIQYCTHTFRNR